MCANKGGPLKPAQVNVQLSVVPSSLSIARKVPWAPLAFGGTSLKVDSRVEKRRPPPSSLLLACVEKFPNKRTAKVVSATLMHSFFISCSFLGTQKTAERENQGCWRPVRCWMSLRKHISAKCNECQ